MGQRNFKLLHPLSKIESRSLKAQCLDLNLVERRAFLSIITLRIEKKATFIGPLSKEATEALKGHFKKKKSTPAKDLNQSQPSASTYVVDELHKKPPLETIGQTSLGVTGEEKAYPQLSILVSTSSTEPMLLSSTIVHSNSALGGDASANLQLKLTMEKLIPRILCLKT
ncbi:hypothetical protein Tco_0054822, partial [Tanacetum coccineum]